MEKRTCGTCTRCCEGWLRADVRGHAMSPGKPCYFLKGGACSDYHHRPKEPCRDYVCAWLADTAFPEALKPNLANIIITQRTTPGNNLTYYEVTETGSTISATVLNWIIRWAIATGTNLVYTVGGQTFSLGSGEFTEVAALTLQGADPL